MSNRPSEFWQFSLDFYSKPEVSTLCLTLQDQGGIDINLLFLLLFLAKNGRRLSAHEVQSIARETAAWSNSVVVPLRTLRRRLKTGFPPMDAVAIEYLRGEIKRCELLAERLQQEMMEQRYPADKTGLPASVLDAATANINAYDALISATSEALPQPVVDSLLQIFGATYAA